MLERYFICTPLPYGLKMQRKLRYTPKPSSQLKSDVVRQHLTYPRLTEVKSKQSLQNTPPPKKNHFTRYRSISTHSLTTYILIPPTIFSSLPQFFHPSLSPQTPFPHPCFPSNMSYRVSMLAIAKNAEINARSLAHAIARKKMWVSRRFIKSPSRKGKKRVKRNS